MKFQLNENCQEIKQKESIIDTSINITTLVRAKRNSRITVTKNVVSPLDTVPRQLFGQQDNGFLLQDLRRHLPPRTSRTSHSRSHGQRRSKVC